MMIAMPDDNDDDKDRHRNKGSYHYLLMSIIYPYRIVNMFSNSYLYIHIIMVFTWLMRHKILNRKYVSRKDIYCKGSPSKNLSSHADKSFTRIY